MQTLDYFPYGEQRIASSSTPFDEQRKFTGHEFDADSDLTYANARYYDHDVRKFLSVDPVFLGMGVDERTQRAREDTQMQNGYGYAGNNPLLYTDPNGEARLRLSGSFVVGGVSAVAGVELDHTGRVGAFFGIGGGLGLFGGLTAELTGGEVSDKPEFQLENVFSAGSVVGITGGTETYLGGNAVKPSTYGLTETQPTGGVLLGGDYSISTTPIQYSGQLFSIPHFPNLNDQQEPLLIQSQAKQVAGDNKEARMNGI